MKKVSCISLSIIAFVVLVLWTPGAQADQTYTNCKGCHGDFTKGPYVSLKDGQSWGDSLHNVHQNQINKNCNVCHLGFDKSVVYLGQSNGATGLDAISCVGCHGRAEDNNSKTNSGYGAGLRQHHYNVGVRDCSATGCHFDANPANYKPVGENILPPYYFTPDAVFTSKPTDPCNPKGEEDFAGTAIGLDNDGDGIYDTKDSDCQVLACVDSDRDGYGTNGAACSKGTAIDCNDSNANINPGASEVCDNVDNNCNGQTDEGVKVTYYRDADGDGYGNPAISSQGCTAPSGYVANNTDCNDNDANLRPNQVWYQDGDGDGYSTGNMIVQCTRPAGYKLASELKATSGDCKDNDAAINPGASDANCNGVDENCSGAADEGYVPTATTCGVGMCATTGQMACQNGATVNTCTPKSPQTEGPNGDPTCSDKADNDCDGTTDAADTNCAALPTVCVDNDNDGYGSNGATTCPKGSAVDCNDSDANINPGATEVCDNVDNNCNGQTDEGVKNTYYADSDSDGYGSPTATTQACTKPAGYVTDNTDCNDKSATINPAASDANCNGVDENCSGAADEGYVPTGTTCGVGMCASTGQMVCRNGATVNTCAPKASSTEGPSGSATCSDSMDNDCDGLMDAADPNCTAQSCTDNDGDGYAAEGGSCGAADCDDLNPYVNPGVTEVCNDMVDQNCNGLVDCADQACSTDSSCSVPHDGDDDDDHEDGDDETPEQCMDNDGDGFFTGGRECGRVDCNDSDASIYPGAPEICGDRIDQNCNGSDLKCPNKKKKAAARRKARLRR